MKRIKSEDFIFGSFILICILASLFIAFQTSRYFSQKKVSPYPTVVEKIFFTDKNSVIHGRFAGKKRSIDFTIQRKDEKTVELRIYDIKSNIPDYVIKHVKKYRLATDKGVIIIQVLDMKEKTIVQVLRKFKILDLKVYNYIDYKDDLDIYSSIISIVILVICLVNILAKIKIKL